MKKAIGIKLDRVPNLSVSTKHSLVSAVRNNSTLGALNVPRNFLQLNKDQDKKVK